MNTRTPLVLAALAALTPAAHAGTGVVSVTDIADNFSPSPYSQVIDYASVNNFGQVAYEAVRKSDAKTHVYLTPRTGSAPIDIAGTTATFGVSTYAAVSDGGTVAFPGYQLTGPSANVRGIYSGSGGALTTVADATTPGYPNLTASSPYVRMSNNGAIVFIGYGVTPGGLPEIIEANNGTLTSIARYNGGTFENLVSPTINNAGQVAFNTDDYSTGSNNGAFVYRYDPATHTSTQLARAFTQTSVSINNAGVVAYEGAPASGSGNPIGIFTNSGTGITTISRVGQPLPGTSITIDNYGADPSGIPINNRGQVAFLGSSNSTGLVGVFLGDGANTINIVKIGDVIFGKTVTGLALGNQALNDTGQVVYRATFNDNTTALVLASTPEPSAVAALAIGILGLGALTMKARKAQKETS